MRNLHLILLQEYGIHAWHLFRDWERLRLRASDYKNHRIFTLRCLHKDLVPVSIKLKSTLKTVKARQIIRKAEKDLLQARVKAINNTLDNVTKQTEECRTQLASIISAGRLRECQGFINKVSEIRFTKVRQRQLNKFNILINKKERNITRANAINLTWSNNLGSQSVRQASTSPPGEGNNPPQTNSQAGTLLPSREGSSPSQAITHLPPKEGSNSTPAGSQSGILPNSPPAIAHLPPREGSNSLLATAHLPSGEGSSPSQAITHLPPQEGSNSTPAGSQSGILLNSPPAIAHPPPGEGSNSPLATAHPPSGEGSSSSQAIAHLPSSKGSNSPLATAHLPSGEGSSLSQAIAHLPSGKGSNSPPATAHLPLGEGRSSSQAIAHLPSSEGSNSSQATALLPPCEGSGTPQATAHPSHREGNSSPQAGQFSNLTRSGRVLGIPPGIGHPNLSRRIALFPRTTTSLPPPSRPPQGSSNEEPNPKWVINLSNKPLTPAQRSVLAKGPSFVVTPGNLLT